MRTGKGFTLFILNEDMNDIIKIIKSLENSGVLIGRVTETVNHEIKKQESGFVGALLEPLAASIVQPVISSVAKGISGEEQEDDIWINILVLLRPLNSIEITTYFNYEPRFNGIFSKNNLPKIKDGVYVINFYDQKSKETHRISLFIDRNTAAYFDSFGIEYIPQEVINKI